MAIVLDLFIMSMAALALLACLGWGYWRWIKPNEANLSLSGKLMLLMIILTTAGGFLGGFGWWFDAPGGFAWDLPPLASRMLASASWSFAFAGFMALQRPSQRRVRLILLMLAVYLTPLLVAIPLFHLNKLDFSAPITYPFLLVVAVLTGGAVWFLIRQPVVLPDEPRDLAPSRTVTRLWLALVSVVSGAWGLALFMTDKGPLPGVWVWPGDLLSSRLIAVMLLTITAAGLYALKYADPARIVTGMTLIYGLGLSAASAWNVLAGKPVKTTYLAVFGLVFLGSLAVLLVDRDSGDRGSKS